MPPDEDGEGRGQGLAMLRLEARRYKQEMQQIWMQRQLHEQKKATASCSSEHSSRVHDDRWRFSDTFTTSPATSGTPMFWNREDVPVSRLEQLVEGGTQTDPPSKSEVQTETENLQFDNDVISTITVPPATDSVFMLQTCSRHCDELRSRISQEAACECLADAAVRVNADVVFTAKPKRVAVEIPDYKYSRAVRPADTETSTMATSPTRSLNKGQKSTDPVLDFRTGLRSLVSPVPQHDIACSPIRNFHEYGARFTSLGSTPKGTTTPTDMFSWQQDKSVPERPLSIAPPPFSTQVSTPQHEASCGGTKAEDNTSDFSTEISGSKRIRNESTGEGAMAARLASKIKHALEAISGKVPGRAIQSTSACRLHYKDQDPEMKLFETACGGRTLNDKDIASSDSSLPETCMHARKLPVSTSQHHSNGTPCSDADIYFQNVMAALCTDRSPSKKLPGSCIAGEVSPARAVVKRVERRAEAARRVNVKACGDHHASHRADGIENFMKTDVPQSGSKHVMEKQCKLLSNVQKLQNVAETAKRLYTDLVDCAYGELRASTDCGNLVKHQDGCRARDVSKFARSEFCPSTEIISAHRADVASTGNDEVCGRCHVCQPQFGNEQPPEEAQTDSLNEITIELSDISPTNIMVSQNGCTERPGYNVEVSTPWELPCQRVCSPTNNRGENIVRRGNASWKDLCKPARTRRTKPAGPGSNQQVKNGSNKCLLDPCCDGPRNSYHMPTRGKYSGATSSPKKYSNTCLLDLRCDGPRNSCHMPTRGKCPGATTLCISPPKKYSTKCRLDPRRDGPRNNCHMSTRGKCSGVATVCISPPKKDPNMCCLDPRCVGPRDSCHMPTYAKNSRASCGPGGSKRNNGTKLGNKDHPSGLSRCPVHRRRGMEPVKGKLESNLCRGRFQSAGNDHANSLQDEQPGHIFFHERKHNCPPRRCRDIISKYPKGCLDGVSKVGTLSEAKDERNLCIVHNGVLSSSSMKGKEIEIAHGGHEKTAGLHHYSFSERMDLNKPVQHVHRAFQECSQVRVVKNHSALKATEDIEKEHASVGKETRQPTVRHMTGNDAALVEACTQTAQSHNPQSDNNVDRAVAAAGLAREIEVMIAEQLGKSNRRIRESNYLMSQSKLPEDQKKDSLGQTKLDIAVIAAANVVKKLKPVSLLPLVKQDERNPKVTPRKGPPPRAKLMAENTIGCSFYDQMYEELEKLSSERMQLVRQERAQFRSQSFFFPSQYFSQEQDRHAGFSSNGRSSYDLKNLANTGEDESRRSVRIQRSEESPSCFWDEPIDSHTTGSKRQRSATSPAREHGNKLLRLNVGKAESQAGRKKQEQHSTLSATSLNQAVIRKSHKGLGIRVRPVNFEPLGSPLGSELSRRKERSVSEQNIEKLNGPSSGYFGRMNTLSLGRWKPAPEEAQAKTTTKEHISTTRKIRPPAWVERMSKAKNVFSSLLRPLLLAHFRKEPQQKPSVRRRISRPPQGLMVRSSLTTSKQFGKHISGGRAFPLMQPNPPRLHSKKSIQYDITTGRKIVYSEPQEPGELLRMRVENQHVRPNIRIARRPVVKHRMMPSAGASLGGNHLRIRGWNADPLIRSDIPHKPADVIRYNRNGGLDVQIRRRDAGGKHKSSTSTQMNIRHVTFAGMVVHNSRYEKTWKGLIVAPPSVDSMQVQVASKKTQPSRIKRATLGKRRSSSTTKVPPMQGKVHRYGGGGGKWTYHEGFWTENCKSELEKVSEDASFESLLTPGSLSEPGTPTLQFRTTQVIENDALHKHVERAGAKVEVKRTEDIDAQSFATNFELRNDSYVQLRSVCTEGDGKAQNPDLFKSLGFFNPDGCGHGAVIDHRNVVPTKVLLSPSRSNEEDERAESCSETKLTVMPKRQAQVGMLNCPNHDDQEQREPKLSWKEFPLRLLDVVFPDSTESEVLVSMFDRLQGAASVHIEAHSQERHPASECITQQTSFPDTQDYENGQLKKLKLERTLMDIALHTILQDDPLQIQEVFATRIEPIALPISHRRVAMRVDKEVEARVHSHDMSQSPLSKVLPYVDRSTEHEVLSHVDRETELDAVPHVDRATELDDYSLFSKDQDSQTTDADFQIQSIHGITSPTQEKTRAKLQSKQVHHQATECRIPWDTVGIQRADNIAPISTASPSPLAAMPMLLPVFFQQLGTSVLPMVLPTINFEPPACMTTSSNLQPPPISPALVDQGTQVTESHIQLNTQEIAAQVPHLVSKLSTSNKGAIGQLGVWEDESDSNWEEFTKGSSPFTPSTPLSSLDHKISLKKAMHLYADNSSIQKNALAKKDPQPLVSESTNDDLQAHQNLVNESAPPIQVVTEVIMDEITAEEPPLITIANETRRGTSWAKVKEIEEAAVTLLRAASMKTPSATSSSECSCETSPEVYTWMSPGEMNVEEGGRSSTGGRVLNNSHTSQVHSGKQTSQKHAWSWFGCGRASIGEVYNPVCFLGPLSEGEIEAGVVPLMGESGLIQNGYTNFASHSRTDLQGQGSEPGEFHVGAADAYSLQKSPTHQISENVQ